MASVIDTGGSALADLDGAPCGIEPWAGSRHGTGKTVKTEAVSICSTWNPRSRSIGFALYKRYLRWADSR
jgi:hypothetical protein